MLGIRKQKIIHIAGLKFHQNVNSTKNVSLALKHNNQLEILFASLGYDSVKYYFNDCLSIYSSIYLGIVAIYWVINK